MSLAVIALLLMKYVLNGSASQQAIVNHFAQSPLAKGMFTNSQIVLKPAVRRSLLPTLPSSTQTVMIEQYVTQGCSGNASLVNGVPFEVCMAGYSSTGKVLGSGIYHYLKEDSNYTYSSYSEFKSSNCSGKATLAYNLYYPKFCYKDVSTGTSLKFRFVNGTNVSTYLKNGILYSYFQDKDHCVNNAPSAQWTFLTLNYCMKTDDGHSVMITGCDNGAKKYFASVFSDSACSNKVYQGDNPLIACATNPDGSANMSGFRYNLYQSHSCF